MACVLAGALPCAASGEVDLTPRFREPRAGFTVDEAFIVELPRQVSMPCVAVVADGATVVVSRGTLEALARRAQPGRGWKDEAERMAMIRADRARSLLRETTKSQAGYCPERAEQPSRESDYLVADLLKSANAMVIDARGGRVTERLRVQYRAAAGVAGRIGFHLDRGPLFLQVDWWIS